MNTTKLPALEGSEKQVAWAEKIRQVLLDDIERMEKNADEDINGRKDENGDLVLLPKPEAKHESILKSLEARKKWLTENVLANSSAKFWIDNRSKNWMTASRRATRNA